MVHLRTACAAHYHTLAPARTIRGSLPRIFGFLIYLAGALWFDLTVHGFSHCITLHYNAALLRTAPLLPA